MKLLHRRPAGPERLIAAMTDPVAVEAEGTCRFCGQRILKMLGLWNNPADGSTTCLSRPDDGGFDHDPGTEQEAGTR